MSIKDFLSTILKQKQEKDETKIQVKQIVVELEQENLAFTQDNQEIRAGIRRRQFRYSSTRTRTQHCH